MDAMIDDSAFADAYVIASAAFTEQHHPCAVRLISCLSSHPSAKFAAAKRGMVRSLATAMSRLPLNIKPPLVSRRQRLAFALTAMCIGLVASATSADPIMPASNGFAWAINEDYKQLDARGASDFEILFRGDIRNQITGGGLSSVTNPFADPTRTASLVAGNTIVRFSGSDTISASTTVDRHFGLFGTGPKPTVLQKFWSYATQPAREPVPKSNFDFSYFPSASELMITLENTSPDTVVFSEVGFLISTTERPIEDLTRSVLPPSVFNPLSVLNGEYLPGQFRSATITGIGLAEFVVTYGTVEFSGASAGQPYNLTGGEWAEVAVASQAIPEPGTALLMVVGLFCFIVLVHCRLVTCVNS